MLNAMNKRKKGVVLNGWFLD